MHRYIQVCLKRNICCPLHLGQEITCVFLLGKNQHTSTLYAVQNFFFSFLKQPSFNIFVLYFFMFFLLLICFNVIYVPKYLYKQIISKNSAFFNDLHLISSLFKDRQCYMSAL